MDSQQSTQSLVERLGSRRDKSRDHQKDYRLSKADIGGPITSGEKVLEFVDTLEVSGTPSMFLRCVVIQRNEKGYGLTVSGDNPVYVQSVKENGAAYTAGVRQGDRIIKVNGTNVTDFNHIEVVKLIKFGHHVALTLVTPPPSQADSNAISASDARTINTSSSMKRPQSALLKDNAFYDEKVNTIKKMLEQEKAEVERIKEEYARNPNKKLLEDLGVAQKLLQDLEKQLWKAESTKQTQDIPIQLINQDPSLIEPQPGFSEMENSGEEQKGIIDTLSKADSEKARDSTNSGQRNIMNFDEDELAVESDNHQNHGPFQDFEILKSRPAHTAVFLNYVFRSQDPCPLLLVLTIEQYRQVSNTKELVKLSDIICKTYLAPNAPLKVTIDEGIAKSIVDTTTQSPRTLSDDTLRVLFDPAAQHALKTVKSQLNRFCNKREQGLSNCFGEEKVSPSMDHNQEVRAVEEILTPLLQDLQTLQNGPDELENLKTNAKLDAMERLVLHWTGKRKVKLSSKIGSMLRPNKPTTYARPKNAGSVESILDEQNKRMSILGKFAPKKTKKDGSLTAKESTKREKNGKTNRESATSVSSFFVDPLTPVERMIAIDKSLHTPKPSHTIKVPRPLIHSDSILLPTGVPLSSSLPTSAPPIREDVTQLSVLSRPPPRQKASLMLPTVIPIVHGHHDSFTGESGQVSSLVNKFQDPNTFSNGSQLSAGETSEGNLRVGEIERSGSFQKEKRSRSATGKSNSDPDLNTAEQALRGNADHVHDSTVSSSISNSSLTSGGIPNLPTSGSLSSAAADDMIRQLIVDNPELDVEPESHWSSTTPREVIKQLDKKEVKRQEIINELLHTEKHHVRDLLILHLLFYQKMQSEGGLSQEDIFTVFPNLQEILAMHQKLRKALTDIKERDGHVVKDIAAVLSAMFDGHEGEKFKNECAKYCGNQTASLEFIKERCKKDQRFNNFIQTTEKHPICRRLQLKDFVPVEFQRLTKYPLLLENIIKNTKKKDEVSKLKRVHRQCKEILHYVNKAVKDAEDYQKIVEIQKNLDSSSLNKVNHPIAQEYKNLNLIERKLVHQGPLTWRITQTEKKKSVVLHCVLFEDIMVLLQKQEDRYVLKCHTSVVPLNSTKEEKSSVQPPILKLSTVLIRNVATDKKAFYVLSTSEFGAQIYELVAMSVHEMQEWKEILTVTAEIAKKKVTTTLGTSRFMKDKPFSSASEPKEIEDDKLTEETDDVDGGSILAKINQKHEEILAALVAKHHLLAAYAGIKQSEFDNIIDMSLEDSDPDQTTLVLQLLATCQKLTMLLNDTLSPDTDFLQPTSSQLLLPTPEITREKSALNPGCELSMPKPSTPTFLNVASTELESSTDENPKIAMKNNWVESDDNEYVDASLSLLQEPTSETSTSDRRSSASLEILMSDYETASEPPSPTSAEEGFMKEGEQSFAENETPSPQAESQEDHEQGERFLPISAEQESSVTSPFEAGIGMSDVRAENEESMNALSAVDTIDNSFRKLVSPIGFDSDYLLDFGAHAVSPPQVTISPSSTATRNGISLLGRANPVDLTKMLQISNSLESRLICLLQSVKDSSGERRQLTKQIEKLQADLSKEHSQRLSQMDESKGDSVDNSNNVLRSEEESYAADQKTL